MKRFKPKSKKPNWVCSKTEDAHEGNVVAMLPKATVEQVKAAVKTLPRVELVTEDGGYLHFVATSRLLRFKDDLEFEVTDEGVHVRSASRVGHSDFGVNRKRVEAIRQILGG